MASIVLWKVKVNIPLLLRILEGWKRDFCEQNGNETEFRNFIQIQRSHLTTWEMMPVEKLTRKEEKKITKQHLKKTEAALAGNRTSEPPTPALIVIHRRCF